LVSEAGDSFAAYFPVFSALLSPEAGVLVVSVRVAGSEIGDRFLEILEILFAFLGAL
jgi:hypothetical protein